MHLTTSAFLSFADEGSDSDIYSKVSLPNQGMFSCLIFSIVWAFVLEYAWLSNYFNDVKDIGNRVIIKPYGLRLLSTE